MATVLLGLVMLVGLLGVVVPLLPGTALILAAGVAWATLVADNDGTRWWVVGGMGLLFLAGLVLKYALPGRRMAGSLPRRTLLMGAAGAAVGFVVLPPLGVLVGGVGGVYLAEAQRTGGRDAWRSTVQVLKAIGIGVLAELAAGVLMVAVWLVGVLVA